MRNISKAVFDCRRSVLLLFLTLILGVGDLSAQNNKIEIWEIIHSQDFPNQCFFVPAKEINHYLLQGANEGEIKAFYPSDKFADFSKPMSINDFRNSLAYWTVSAEDTSFIQAADLKEFEIQGFLIPDNRTQASEIQAISLIKPSSIDLNEKTFATFRWDEVKKYLNETFRQSLSKENFEDLEAYWYHLEDNTLQISLAEALEKRYFKSSKFFLNKSQEAASNPKSQLSTQLIAQYHLPKNLKGQWICNAKEQFKPKKTGELSEPYFLKLPNGKLTTTTYSILDFQKMENRAFIEKSNLLVKYLLEGIENQRIIAYRPSYPSQTFDNKMAYNEVAQELSYYTNDAAKPDTVPIQAIHLELKRYYFKALNNSFSKSQLVGISLIFEDKILGIKPIAYLKFEEVQKYLEDIYEKSGKRRAIWKNPQINQEKMSFASALALEKYESELIYFSNPERLTIKDISYKIYMDLEDERVKKFIQQLTNEESQKIKKKIVRH
ncbi:MAG: hypothetical protein MUE85_08340 [Microscillaceae bacterium]|jgi:hypothetical protein|nr:hypothetical protein [Microscillaceae bacterium]